MDDLTRKYIMVLESYNIFLELKMDYMNLLKSQYADNHDELKRLLALLNKETGGCDPGVEAIKLENERLISRNALLEKSMQHVKATILKETKLNPIGYKDFIDGLDETE